MAAFLLATVASAVWVSSAAAADDIPAAQRFAVGSPAMQTAQQIAHDTWGQDACGGQVTVEWGTDDANVNARSYWANPVASYDAPEQNVQCRVVFNAGMAFSWPKFCTVLVHEYGHLTGHPHTADGSDVMSPIYRAPLPACLINDPTAVPAPAPAPAPASSAPPATSAPAALATTPATTATSTPRRAARRASAHGRAQTRSAPRALAASASRAFATADAEPRPWLPFAEG